MDFLPSASVVAFLVIQEFFRRLNPPWMAFAFVASVFAMFWLESLRRGWLHKFFPDFPSILIIVLMVLVLGYEAWDWRRRSRSQQ